MNSIKRLAGRGLTALSALAMIAGVLAPVFISQSVSAAGQFSPRKLTMSSQASGSVSTDANGSAVAAGAGGNGAKAKHTFDITPGTSAANPRSILVQYCTTPFLDTACTAPTGMDASTVASVVSPTNFNGVNPTIDTTTVANTGGIFTTSPCSGSGTFRTNCVLLSRATGALVATPALSFAFGTGGGTDWIKNPTSVGTFYVRVYMFSDTAYTTQIDSGAVAGSVNTAIDITAKVQEKLNFSVSGTPSTPNGATCTALSGSGAIALGDGNGVLDSATAYDTRSYFRLSTNASNGTSVLYSGDTLKTVGGTNSITAAASGGASSTVGSAQFGLGLDSTDTQSGNGYSFTNLTGSSPYAAANGTITNGGTASFAFNTSSVTTPIQIASASAGTVVGCDTGAIRYIGNIATTTKAGVYKTTISYIAVPAF